MSVYFDRRVIIIYLAVLCYLCGNCGENERINSYLFFIVFMSIRFYVN